MNRTTDQLIKGVAAELQLNDWYTEFLGSYRPDGDTPLNFELAAANLPKTEGTAAEILAAKLRGRVSYVEAESTWFAWDGKIHRPIQSADKFGQAMAKLYHRALTEALGHVKASYVARGKSDVVHSGENGQVAKNLKAYRDRFKEARSMRDRLSSAAGRNAVIQLLRAELTVDPDHFLDDRRWLVVSNGVFDMDAVWKDRRFDLLPHDPSRPVYRMIDVEDRPGAGAPALGKFLNGSVADRSQADFLSKAVALAIMGTPQRTKTIVSLQGAHNSGKSMLNDCLAKLAPDYVAAPDPSAITRAGTMKKELARYPMRNARYVGFSEVRDDLDERFVLAYTGGDRYTVEQKYVPAQTVLPQGVIFIASNTPLSVDKSDPAMFSRVAPVCFPHTFSKADPEHQEDDTLGERIVAQGSGFLEWLKKWYLDYLNHGLDKTDSMEALKRVEREDEDPVAAFLEATDQIVPAPEAAVSNCVTVSKLHAEFQTHWSRRGKRHPDLDKRETFKQRLGALGYATKKSNGLRVHGLIESIG